MSERKKPTSALLHERDRLAGELYRACADGRIKDIKKLRTSFEKSCQAYNQRLLEEEQIQKEKEAKKLTKQLAKEKKNVQTKHKNKQ